MKKDKNIQLGKYRNLIAAVFAIIIILVPLIETIIPDKTFSEYENRVLATFPSVTLKGIKDGTYMKDFSKYFEDHFPLRDTFVTVKGVFEKMTLRSEINDVYINKSNRLIGKFMRNSDQVSKEKAQAINDLAKKNLGKNITVMLIPNKVEIYKNQLPFKAPSQSQKDYLKYFYELLTVDINKIDMTDIFTKNRDQELYFRSDHHWTQKGAFLAASEYLKESGGKAIKESDYKELEVSKNFYGTLASKSGIRPGTPDSLSVFVPTTNEDVVINLPDERVKMTSFYKTDMLGGKDKYLVFMGGNYSVARIQTSSSNNKRLLIIKDSYANAMVTFLTKEFNEITMIDPRYFNGDLQSYIDDYGITDILVLYNINTFNDDPSILNIAEN